MARKACMVSLQQSCRWWLLRVWALFARHRSKLSVLVNKPFVTRVKLYKVVGSHASSQYHVHAVEEALEFKRSIEQTQVNVDVCMNAELLHYIQENRHVKGCAESILYCS